jgi:diamine N-acetyltransferase
MALSGRVSKRIWYVSGNEALLDEVKTLWEALNQHHLECSRDFRQHYLDMTWEKRKHELLRRAEAGEMHLDLAMDEASGKTVGYCISSINTEEKTGEVESIYVEEAFRKRGIGGELMLKALAWIDHQDAEKKTVAVAAGNEEAFKFYRRFGFVTRKTVLEQL